MSKKEGWYILRFVGDGHLIIKRNECCLYLEEGGKAIVEYLETLNKREKIM